MCDVPDKRVQNDACISSAEREEQVTKAQPKGNVPALRFPEFTEEWEKCKLGDITINFNLRNKDRINYPMYSVTNNKGFVPQSEQFEDREMIGEDIKAYKIIHKNDFAYNPARINVGSIAKYNGDNPCMISSLYVCFKACDRVDADWLMQLLKTSKMNFYYNVNGEGGVRIYLFYPNFARISTYLPVIAEQKKIAKFLSLLDERIVTQNKIIEDLKKLKSAIADKLYSSAKGEIYSFRQIFDEVNEKNKKLTYSNVLSASQEFGMIERGDINIDIKFEQGSIIGYKIVRKGDYVVHLRSFQGGFAFSDKTGICSPAYTIIRPNDSVAYGYLSHFFTSRLFIKSLKLVTYGIRDGRSINVDEWLNMTVILPTIQEQLHIIEIINSISSKLYNETRIYYSLLRQKLYLLKAMFI